MVAVPRPITSLVTAPIHVPMYGPPGGSADEGLDDFEQAPSTLAPVSSETKSSAGVRRAPLSAIECNKTSTPAGKVHESVDRVGHPHKTVARVWGFPPLHPGDLIDRNMMSRRIRHIDVPIVDLQAERYGAAARNVVSPLLLQRCEVVRNHWSLQRPNEERASIAC